MVFSTANERRNVRDLESDFIPFYKLKLNLLFHFLRILNTIQLIAMEMNKWCLFCDRKSLAAEV